MNAQTHSGQQGPVAVTPLRLLVALACCTGVAGAVSAAPTARITASRTSGPAPLAVHFDATATTDSSGADTFRQTGYRFSFGDSSSGTWQYSNLSKNEQIGGPLAAHVFDTPGTYVVRVTAKDASGGSSDATVTITVESPDSVYAGTNTVCISRSSNFTGCPSGAQTVGGGGWPSFQSNKRYLLRAGEDFTSLGNISLGQFQSAGVVNFQLGSFGSGAKPRVNDITLFGSQDPTTSNRGRPERVTIMNLDTPSIDSQYSTSDMLIYKNAFTRGGNISLASVFSYQISRSHSNGWQLPDKTFIVENTIGATDNAGEYGIIGTASARLAIMGNLVDRTGQHNVRLGQAYKTIVAHNRLAGHSGDQMRHGLKLHAQGLGASSIDVPSGTTFNQRSAEIVVANNSVGSTDNIQNWLVTLSPQNNEYAEGIERAIVEDNRFTRGQYHSLDIYFVGRNMTDRGNFNVTTNATTTFTSAGTGSAVPGDWQGPYYWRQPSMRSRFSTSTTVPMSPVLRVE